MQCHYCEREAAFSADHEGVRVGLCEEHFRERVEAITEADSLAELRDQVDIDRAE